MIPVLLGTKEGQSQTFTESGMRIPVTEITAGPCYITGIRDALSGKNVQLGFKEGKHITKALEGHLKKAGLTKKLRFLHSVTVPTIDETIVTGKEIRVEDVFAVGDRISVTGTSKGKGFAGVVKRHGFHGGPRTHGQSDRERAPGSIGQTTTPGRVYKGKRMAGRMGSDTVTVTGLKVVGIKPETNTLLVKGLIPGTRDSLVVVSKEG